MPARHAAETLQRHQRDAEVARGRQVEDAGSAAVIDSAHQADQGDEDMAPAPDPSPEAANTEPAESVTESRPDSGGEQRATAEAPAGLARIRTAAANATSALLGVTRAVGGAMGTSRAEPETAGRRDSGGDEMTLGASDAGVPTQEMP